MNEAVPANSREAWRHVRAELNKHRHELAAVASGLYPDVSRVGGTPLMCRPEWVPERPIPLDQVALHWTEHAPSPAVTGAEDASASVRPTDREGHRYPTYAEALAALDPPATFEDRLAYRLLTADLASEDRPAAMGLTSSRYFDGVNIGEALGHELAAAWLDDQAVTMERLPFRRLIGDPCDLARRSAGNAITTITIRRGATGGASFLLHWRDPAKVTHAGGMYQVMPVGVFQPADDNSASTRNDLSLWRSMVREFSEELLGTAEDYASLGSPLDYGRWPFYRELAVARDAGRLNVWCLGLGADPLTLAIDIITVAVFDAGVFDALFGGLVAANAEGRVVGRDADSPTPGMPFSADAIDRITGGAEPLQAAGAAVLRSAWEQRKTLLA